ncbi:MAG: winged helix-turn-helix transcriptional regulator [Candidatus Paceibacterota bacterium]|jgi:hypothetical protein
MEEENTSTSSVQVASTSSAQVENTEDMGDIREKRDTGVALGQDSGQVVEEIQVESQADSSQPSSPEITEPVLPTVQVEETPVVAPTQSANFDLQGLAEKMKAAIFGRREKKLAKILDYLNANGKIKNEEIRKLVRVSSATATRYMNILEERKQVEQIRTKRHAFYKKI